MLCCSELGEVWHSRVKINCLELKAAVKMYELDRNVKESLIASIKLSTCILIHRNLNRQYYLNIYFYRYL